MGKPACKQLAGFLTGPKSYRVHFRLGYATDTQDSSGSVIESAEYGHVSEETMRRAMAKFVGKTLQLPPMYSAVKLGGVRLYDLARNHNLVVERQPREIDVHRLELLSFEPPWCAFECTAASGTYMRTLVHDIGVALNTRAVATDIIRTVQGSFSIDQSLSLPLTADDLLRVGILIQSSS
ncbi:MAG: hypothetical protein Q8P67_12525 [archaeon]|nr:hypothetical protein [archaeon]